MRPALALGLLLLPLGGRAAQLATVETALVQGLRPLNGPGYAVLSGPLIAVPERDAIIRQVRALPAPIFSTTPGTSVLVWERSVGEVPGIERTIPAVGALTGLLAALDASLSAALPDEALALRSAELRGQDERAGGDYLHADGQYLTLTYALEGPGTTLYPAQRAAPPAIRTRAGEAVVITNLDRERATGRPATVHSSPLEGVPPRVLFIARWNRRLSATRGLWGERFVRARIGERVRSVRDRLAALGLPTGGDETEKYIRENLGLAPVTPGR